MFPLRSWNISALGSFGRRNQPRIMSSVCSLLPSSCFLVRSSVAHHGREIGCLALGFVLVLLQTCSLFFVYAVVVFLGLAIAGPSLVFVLALCLTAYHPP